MFTFDVYEAGAVYGEASFVVTPDLVARWHAVYDTQPQADDKVPAGIVVLIQQKAYKDVVTPRPPGHVQGGQWFALSGRIVVGAEIRTIVSCVDKELRGGRRWVRMGFEGRIGDVVIYNGINTVLVPQ